MNITDLLKDPEKAKEVLEKVLDDKNKELAEILIPVVRDPYLTYAYASEIVEGKIKDEWEDIIMQNAKYSYFYAFDVIKEPWPKGEDAIAQADDVAIIYDYATEILHDRFKKGEDSIIRIDKGYVEAYMEFLKKISKLDEFLKDHPEVKSNL